MKRILCFGDSNTFGFDPQNWGRYEYSQRWTGVLQKLLGASFQIIEEGCCGRTTVFDDPVRPNSAGRTHLEMLLESHRPLDLVILCLGTNDLKRIFHLTASEVALGMGELVRLVLRHDYGVHTAPQVLVLSPILIGKGIESKQFFGFGAEATEESKYLADKYKEVADFYGCGFMSAAWFAGPSETDLLHMDETGHAKLAKALAMEISRHFSL